MKKLIYLLLALPFFITSCNNEEMVAGDETVVMSFYAELPQGMSTRASSTPLVDKVYCAVFENNVEIPALRETITIEEGNEIVFSPRLILGHTYDIVFWAAKEGSYNVADMTAITRNANIEEIYADAFTAHTNVTVNNANKTAPIALTRPFAQLNIGVTQEDWDGVASPSTFNMVPTNITIALRGKNKFNALTGIAIGNDEQITYNLSAIDETLSIDGVTYKILSMCYVLPEGEKENFDVTFSVYDQNGSTIRKDATINAIPLQTNYKTNVVGGLLTGTITYNITLKNGFNSDDNKKEIE